MSTRLEIEVPQTDSELESFAAFEDAVYEHRSARWFPLANLILPVLKGQSAFSAGRLLRPFVVRLDGRIIARAVAMMDSHYNAHWHETLGHLVAFEAIEGSYEGTLRLVDAASAWLKQRGAKAVRAGFSQLDTPFTIDNYESLPPLGMRHNPQYYHSLLKDAGFVSERGFVGYKIQFDNQSLVKLTQLFNRTQERGNTVVSFKDLHRTKAVSDYTRVINQTLASHWGYTPISEEEVSERLDMLKNLAVLECSSIIYRKDQPLGALLCAQEGTKYARLRSGRILSCDERLNVPAFLGVVEGVRGLGAAAVLTKNACEHFLRQGLNYFYYGPVLDDNWPSRRVARLMGGSVSLNYVVYRRELDRGKN